METINWILGCFTLAGVLGTVAASFYGVRQKTTITILTESNKAYSERNKQLEESLKRVTADSHTRISQLEGRVHTLERIKTPPLDPLMQLVQNNHTQVMQALQKDNVYES